MKGGVKTHYKSKHCSPKKTKTGYSCLSKKAILKIAKALNKLSGIKVTYKGVSDKDLYNKISKIMQNNFNCKTEACWLKIRKLMTTLSKKDATYFRKHFRPHMPEEIIKDYTEWISNFDIEAVLNQYHEETDDFYFYGAVPIDFKKCSVSNLCSIDIYKHLDKGENKIGIVFNTDKSNEPGEHWMAYYVDLKGANLHGQPGIYFFDSFGSSPCKEVKELTEKIKKQGSKKNIKFVVSHNDKSYQRNTYSCGFYSIHFLEHMIKGFPFKKYLNSGLTDKKMIEFRNQCFLHPQEIKY
jgi:ribosome biogenesis protein Tsr3